MLRSELTQNARQQQHLLKVCTLQRSKHVLKGLTRIERSEQAPDVFQRAVMRGATRLLHCPFNDHRAALPTPTTGVVNLLSPAGPQ